MGIIIPFQDSKDRHPNNFNTEGSREALFECGNKNTLLNKSDTLDVNQKQLFARSFTTSSEIESFLLGMNKPQPLDSRLEEVETIVVFCPEIISAKPTCEETNGLSGTQWGDVFIKTGDEYPFIFTVYTKCYVKKYFLLHGEMITPSSKDIILNRPLLTQKDVVQATIKWVNCYYPKLKGLPISLESEEVVQELICDPGEEVIISDSTELYL